MFVVVGQCEETTTKGTELTHIWSANGQIKTTGVLVLSDSTKFIDVDYTWTQDDDEKLVSLSGTATTDDGKAVQISLAANEIVTYTIGEGQDVRVVTADMDGVALNPPVLQSITDGVVRQPPALHIINDVVVSKGEVVSVSLVTVNASVDDNTAITFESDSSQLQITLNSQTLAINTDNFAGVAKVTVTVSTDVGSASRSFNVTVKDQLEIKPISDSVYQNGSTYLVPLTIYNAQTDLTYSANSLDTDVATVSITDNNHLSITTLSTGTSTIEVAVADGTNPAVSTSFGLTVVAAINNSNSNTVSIAGPLSGASVELYDLALIRNQSKTITDLEAANEYDYLTYTSTDETGVFDFGVLDYLDDNQYYLLKASGGSDLDANGDGNLNDELINQGSVYALLSGAQLKAGNVKVSPLTDIAYHFTKSALHLMSAKETSSRLDYVTEQLIMTDLNEDTLINQLDTIRFVATNSAHLESLAWAYGVGDNLIGS